jgi:hypothetical protein
VQNADEINFKSLSTNPTNKKLGDVWFRSDADELVIETKEGVKRLKQLRPVGSELAVTSGLVAWYRIENTNNNINTAVDATNNLGVGSDQTAYTVTNNGATFQSNAGARDVINSQIPSGSYSFDGVDDKLITNGTVPIDTGSITLMTWVSVDSNTNKNGRIFSNNDSADFRKFIIEGDTNDVGFALGDGSSNVALSGPGLTANELTHLALTGDGTNATAYVNASPVASTSGGYPSNKFNIKLTLGASQSRPLLKGIVDDSRVYNRPLPASEINQVFQNTKP